MAKASKKHLESLHDAVAIALKSLVEDGREVITKDGDAERVPVDAATLSAAIKFLKDNGITAHAAEGSPTEQLIKSLEATPELEDAEFERIKKECVGNG